MLPTSPCRRLLPAAAAPSRTAASRGRRILAIVLPAVPAGGCCSMARLFCGPDRSPWVPISHQSPRETLATFLEAIRRDAPDRVYECLARSYLTAHGLDRVGMNAFWERLRTEVPYLHLLGYATVPDQPAQATDGGVTFTLTVEGRELRVAVVRQSYWEVRYRDADGVVRRPSGALDFDTLNHLVTVQSAGFDPDDRPLTKVDVGPLTVAHPYLEHLQLRDIDGISVGREWKIADLTLAQ